LSSSITFQLRKGWDYAHHQESEKVFDFCQTCSGSLLLWCYVNCVLFLLTYLFKTKLLFQDPSVHDASQPMNPPVDDGFNPFARQLQQGETPKVHTF